MISLNATELDLADSRIVCGRVGNLTMQTDRHRSVVLFQGWLGTFIQRQKQLMDELRYAGHWAGEGEEESRCELIESTGSRVKKRPATDRPSSTKRL